MTMTMTTATKSSSSTSLFFSFNTNKKNKNMKMVTSTISTEKNHKQKHFLSAVKDTTTATSSNVKPLKNRIRRLFNRQTGLQQNDDVCKKTKMLHNQHDMTCDSTIETYEICFSDEHFESETNDTHDDDHHCTSKMDTNDHNDQQQQYRHGRVLIDNNHDDNEVEIVRKSSSLSMSHKEHQHQMGQISLCIEQIIHLVSYVFDTILQFLHYNTNTTPTISNSNNWYDHYCHAYYKIMNQSLFIICIAILCRQPYILHGISLIVICHMIRYTMMWYDYHIQIPSNIIACQGFISYWNKFISEGCNYAMTFNDTYHDNHHRKCSNYNHWYYAWGRVRDIIAVSALLHEMHSNPDESYFSSIWRCRMSMINTMMYEEYFDVHQRYTQIQYQTQFVDFFNRQQQKLQKQQQKLFGK